MNQNIINQFSNKPSAMLLHMFRVALEDGIDHDKKEWDINNNRWVKKDNGVVVNHPPPRYNRSEIFRRAWVIFRGGSCVNFSLALKQSWAEAKFRNEIEIKQEYNGYRY